MNIWGSVGTNVGFSGLLYIVIVLICIAISWWALQAFRFDIFLHDPKSKQAKVLQIFISVILGYQAAKFLIDYANWSMLLRWML
jgi:uncharacterized integral membrane protein (TIGR02327 family)